MSRFWVASCLVVSAIAINGCNDSGRPVGTSADPPRAPEATKEFERNLSEVDAIWKRTDEGKFTDEDWLRARKLIDDATVGQDNVLLVAKFGRYDKRRFKEADEILQRKLFEEGIPNRMRWLEAYAYFLGLPGPPDEREAFRKSEGILDKQMQSDSLQMDTEAVEFVERQFNSDFFGRKLSTLWILHFADSYDGRDTWAVELIDKELTRVQNPNEKKFWQVARKVVAQPFK